MKYTLRAFFGVLFLSVLSFQIQAQSCDTIGNYSSAYTPTILSLPAPNWGYVSGHNSFNDIAKADYFNYTGTNTHVTGSFMGFGYAFTLDPTSTVTATVWDGTGGTPGSVLGQQDILITDIIASITSFQLHYVEFDTPVELASNEFFLGFTMTAGPDTVAIITSSPGNVPAGFSTAWEQQSDSTWHNYNAATSWGFDAAHSIFPILGTEPTARFSPSNATGCIGSAITYDASSSINASTYEWIFPGGTPATSTMAMPVVTYAASGQYDVTLIVTNGCMSDTLTRTNMVEIVNYCPPTCDLVTTILAVNPNCTGGSDGFAWTQTSGGTAPYSFQWGTSPVQTTDTAFNLAAGTYPVTITDATGCFVITDVTLSDPPQLQISLSKTDPTVCNGTDGTASVMGTGGTGAYTYAWASMGNPVGTTSTISGLGQGTYMVTVTDANGCTQTGSVMVTDGCNNCNLVLNVTGSSPSCGQNNGSVTANVTGGTMPYSYQWNPAVGSGQMLTNVGAGTYFVTVTDAAGCVDSSFVTLVNSGVVTINMLPEDDFWSDNGASVTAVASGGSSPYTFLWNTGDTSATITGLSTGSYDVTITDANGCSASSSAAVTSINSGPVLSINQTNVSCNGASDGEILMTINSGNAPFSIFWTPLNISSQNLTNLSAGNYTALVVDQQGCIATTTVVISEPNTLAVAPTSEPSTGNDGTATANVSGGTPPFTYLWNTGDTTQMITNLTIGTYDVTVTDANGCTSSGSVDVSPFTNTTNLSNLTEFNLYPNPSDGRFTIDVGFENRQAITLSIFNVVGQKVFEYTGDEANYQIPVDISSKGKGAYFVTIETDRGRAVRRIIIQ